MADPQAFLRGAERRLRAGGPAAPVMTLLTMLDIARVARARAPGLEAAERARLDAAAAAARAAEQRWSLPASDDFRLDERSEAWAGLPAAGRSEVTTAYRVYRSQVEAWQHGAGADRFLADLGRRPRDRVAALYRGLARVRPGDGAERRRPPAALRPARQRRRALSPLARLLCAGAAGDAGRRRRRSAASGCGRWART